MENKKNMFDMSPRKKGDKPNPFRFNLYWMYGLIFVMLIALYMTNDTAGSKDLDWTQGLQPKKDGRGNRQGRQGSDRFPGYGSLQDWSFSKSLRENPVG